MKAIGVAVDGGKDSLSMAASANDEVVKAPGALVITCYAECPDVRRVVLEALGKIGNFEAAEFLWSLLRSEAEDEQERAIRDAAGQVFVQLLTSEWRAIFQSQLNTEPEEVQRRLGPILTGMRS